MKLFFHWLRWDLRRFRVMLLIWSALVLAYGAFLTCLHLNIVTVDPDFFDFSKPWAVLLAVAQSLMLIYLFSSDPALGSDSFWKTKPPTGSAVAGSKLALAWSFFFLLPLGIWALVKAVAGPDFILESCWGRAPGVLSYYNESRLSWTWFLIVTQSLTIGLLTLASVSIRSSWHLPIRLGLALLLVVLPDFIALSFTGQRRWSIGPIVEMVLGLTHIPVACFVMSLAAAMVYAGSRANRTPARIWVPMSVVLPVSFIMVAVLLPTTRPALPLVLDDLKPVPANSISVEGYVAPSFGPSKDALYSFSESWAHWNHYPIDLKISGLKDTPAVGVWKDLSLTTPEGEVIQADLQLLPPARLMDARDASRQLRVLGASFSTGDMARFAFKPCRAEGVVRIYLFGKSSSVLNLASGEKWQTPQGRFYYPEEYTAKGFSNQLVWSLDPGKPMEQARIIHRKSGESWSAQLTEHGNNTGLLMLAEQESGYIDLTDTEKTWKSARRRYQLMEKLDLREWSLHLTWREPVGFMDVPVLLDSLVLAGMDEKAEQFVSRLNAITWPAEGSEEDKRKALRVLISIASTGGHRTSLFNPTETAVQAFLEKTTSADLPLLMELVRDRIGGYSGKLVVDQPLRARIKALATPTQLESWKADQGLNAFLQMESPKEKWARFQEQANSSDSASAATLTDEALEAWDLEPIDSDKPVDMVCEGLRRGLSWAVPAMVEMVMSKYGNYSRVRNYLHETCDRTVAKMIEIPEGQKKQWAWLKENQNNLVFDPVRRKWFLPAPDQSNPRPVQEN